MFISFSEQISKGSYVLLGLLRMGNDCGIIQYLADAYDASQERGGVMMRSPNLGLSHVKYSRCARAYFSNCADSGANNVTDSGSNDEIDPGSNNMIDSGLDDMNDSGNDVIDAGLKDLIDLGTIDETNSGTNDGLTHISQNKAKRIRRVEQWSVVALKDGN